MRLAVLAFASLFCADAAFAQLTIGRGAFERGPDSRGDYGPPPGDHAAIAQDAPTACPPRDKSLEKASKPFVDNFNVASVALQSRDGAGALVAAALARPHAATQRQRAAVLQIEVAAYHELGNEAALAEKLEVGLTDGCVPAIVRKNYRQMLDKMRAGSVGDGGAAPR
jgi:hypothetical protein